MIGEDDPEFGIDNSYPVRNRVDQALQELLLFLQCLDFLLQSLGHTVERGSQLLEFVWSGHPAARGQITTAQTVTQKGEPFGGPDHEPSDEPPSPADVEKNDQCSRPHQEQCGSACLVSHGGGVVIHVENPVDRLLFHRTVTFETGWLVVHRVDAAQNFRPIGCFKENRGACRWNGLWLNDVGIAREPYLTGRIGDEYPGDLLLLSEPPDDVLEAFEIAFEHRVFQGGLEELVHLGRGAGTLFFELRTVQAHEQHEKHKRTQQQPCGCTDDKFPVQAMTKPSHYDCILVPGGKSEMALNRDRQRIYSQGLVSELL